MTLCIDAGVTEGINPSKCITLEIGFQTAKMIRYAARINTREVRFFNIYWRRFQEAQSLLPMQNCILLAIVWSMFFACDRTSQRSYFFSHGVFDIGWNPALSARSPSTIPVRKIELYDFVKM